jgi:hypothetical protein
MEVDFIVLVSVFVAGLSVLAMVFWIGIYKRLYKNNKKEAQGWRWFYVSILGILVFNISSIYMLYNVNDPVYELINVIGRTLIGLSMTIGSYMIFASMRKGSLYSFVSIMPVTERESETKSVLPEIIKKGQSYLIEEEKPVKSNDIFVKLVNHGIQGLYITRRFPQEVRDTYNLRVTPIIWLTHEKTDLNHINPTDIVELSHTVKEFVKKTNDGLILLDGIEYLITQNDFKDILKFVQSLNDSIASSNSRLIIPVDQSTLVEQQFHLLKRDLKVLETETSLGARLNF